jgi:hypothetical protein
MYFYVCQEGSCLDLAQVSDVRFGSFAKSPKDAKTREMLLEGSGSLDERLVSIAYGTNMVEINFINFSAPSVEVAKVFGQSYKPLQEMYQYIETKNGRQNAVVVNYVSLNRNLLPK